MNLGKTFLDQENYSFREVSHPISRKTFVLYSCIYWQLEIRDLLFSLQVQGGGNVGNALTAAARLGIDCRIFTKVNTTICVFSRY